MLTFLTLTCVGAMFVFVAKRVISALLVNDSTRRALIAKRKLVAACISEIAAGAEIVYAVESAASGLSVGVKGRDVKSAQRLQAAAFYATAQVRMGMSPGDVRLDETNDAKEQLAEFLRLWQVAQAKGLSFSTLGDGMVADLEAMEAQRDKAGAAMAGARMTEILLLALPIGAIGVGESIGLGPLNLLLGNTIGSLLLLVGATLASGGVLWTESLTVKALSPSGLSGGARAGPSPLEAARTLDVFASALEAGLPVSKSWAVAVAVAVPVAKPAASKKP